jgi:hypothetical protein
VCKAGCNAAAEEGEEFDPEADMATASAEKRSVEDGDLVARGSVVPLPGVVSDTYCGRYGVAGENTNLRHLGRSPR